MMSAYYNQSTECFTV